MNKKNAEADAKLNVLAGIACIVAVVVVVGLGRTTARLLHSPAPPAPALAEPGEDKTPRTLAAVMRSQPWQARQVAQQRAQQPPEDVLAKLKPAAIADDRELRAKQMAALRANIAANANDDLDATLSAEAIAELESKGVMVW